MNSKEVETMENVDDKYDSSIGYSEEIEMAIVRNAGMYPK